MENSTQTQVLTEITCPQCGKKFQADVQTANNCPYCGAKLNNDLQTVEPVSTPKTISGR